MTDRALLDPQPTPGNPTVVVDLAWFYEAMRTQAAEADLLAERDRLAAALAAIAALHETDEDNHCVTCSPQDGGRPCCTLREILDLRYGEEAQP